MRKQSCRTRNEIAQQRPGSDRNRQQFRLVFRSLHQLLVGAANYDDEFEVSSRERREVSNPAIRPPLVYELTLPDFADFPLVQVTELAAAVRGLGVDSALPRVQETSPLWSEMQGKHMLHLPDPIEYAE